MIFALGHAVVIGVGADLPNTVDDAKALATILRDPERCAYPPDQVRVLTQDGADRGKVLTALEELVARADSESTAIVYYSGHGYFVTAQAQREYFLLPFGHDMDDLAGTAISDAAFAAVLGRMKAKKLLLLLDCCHAAGLDQKKAPGATLEKGPIPPQAEAILRAGSGRVVIASSRADEVSFAGKPYSAFTQALIEGLAGSGANEQDGYARVADLAMYTSWRVPARTKDRQHPVLNFEKADNFPVAFYAGGDPKPKGTPFEVPAEVEPEPGAWPRVNIGFINVGSEHAAGHIFHIQGNVDLSEADMRVGKPEPEHS
jgi:hypothetical protein